MDVLFCLFSQTLRRQQRERHLENVTSRFFFIPSTENYFFRSMALDSSLFSKDKKTVKTFFAVYLVLI